MNDKQIIDLINHYKDHECLWNINSKLFRRTDIKSNAYRKIAAEMQMDEVIIKRKLKNLRTAYTAEKKKILNSKKSGAGLEEIVESSLFYFDAMSFLDPCIVYRKGKNNLDNFDSNTSELSQISSESSHTNEFYPSEESCVEEDVDRLQMNPPPTKNNKTSDANDTVNFDDALNKFISTVNSEPAKDQFSIFGESVATQLRQVPEINAVQCMGEIHQVLTNMRVRVLNATASTSQFCPLPSVSPCSSSSSSSGIYVEHNNMQQAQYRKIFIQSSTPIKPPSTSTSFQSYDLLQDAMLSADIDENVL